MTAINPESASSWRQLSPPLASEATVPTAPWGRWAECIYFSFTLTWQKNPLEPLGRRQPVRLPPGMLRPLPLSQDSMRPARPQHNFRGSANALRVKVTSGTHLLSLDPPFTEFWPCNSLLDLPWPQQSVGGEVGVFGPSWEPTVLLEEESFLMDLSRRSQSLMCFMPSDFRHFLSFFSPFPHGNQSIHFVFSVILTRLQRSGSDGQVVGKAGDGHLWFQASDTESENSGRKAPVLLRWGLAWSSGAPGPSSLFITPGTQE